MYLGSTRVPSPAVLGLIIGLAVCFVVMALRYGGKLQTMELAAYDTFLQSQPQVMLRDPNIVLVKLSETDLRHQGQWPLSDGTVARLLRILLDQQPRVIGLDMYRDIPVPPGSEELVEVFSRNANIVTVKKLGDDKSPGVPQPYVVKDDDIVGFNDLLVDPGGIARRGILFMNYGQSDYRSLALLLALYYLHSEGIGAQSDPYHPEVLRLGKTTIVPFESDSGGYSGADARGYQFLLDFSSLGSAFTSLSLSDVLEDKLPKDLCRDKVVIVCASAESLNDFFFIPFSRSPDSGQRVFGGELHASAVSQLIRCAQRGTAPMDYFGEIPESAWILLWSVLGCVMGLKARSFWQFLVSNLCALSILVFGALALFRGGFWIPVVPPALACLFSGGLLTSFTAYREKAQRAILMRLFSSHVSRDVAEALWEQKDQFTDNGRPRPRELVATVLFTDLRGFASIAEKLEAGALIDWLNEYMEAMTKHVMSHGGMVNKFIGDAVMALFGVPVGRTAESEIDSDACSALHCALAMKKELEELNKKWSKNNRPTVNMRVGIFTGPLVVGCIGSVERLEYTVIGDTANIASRLENFDKTFDADNTCRILIGDATLRRLNGRFFTRKLGEVALKGKKRKVGVYQVLGLAEGRTGQTTRGHNQVETGEG